MPTRIVPMVTLGLAGVSALVLAIIGHGAVNTDTDQRGEERLDEATMLTAASTAVAMYRDIAEARGAGFQPVTGVLPGSGMHLVSQQNLDDDGFDVLHPEVLLYDDDPSGALELVGVAYLLPQRSGSTTPPEEFGPLAHWHAHHYLWPCLTEQTEGRPVTVDTPESSCRAEGDLVIPTRFWMLHVWLFRPSPTGIFSPLNNSVKPSEILVEGSIK